MSRYNPKHIYLGIFLIGSPLVQCFKKRLGLRFHIDGMKRLTSEFSNKRQFYFNENYLSEIGSNFTRIHEQPSKFY